MGKTVMDILIKLIDIRSAAQITSLLQDIWYKACDRREAKLHRAKEAEKKKKPIKKQKVTR